MKKMLAGIKGNRRVRTLLCLSLFSFATGSIAADLTLGGMASQITGSFTQLTKLITAASYLGGIAFSIGAIMKFKQHKDSPTQIQIGQPIGLTFIGAALLFLPTMLEITGATLFGSGGGSTAGPTGTVI